MKKISLTQGKFALVDDEDYEQIISQGKWYAYLSRRTWYARRWIDGKLTSMHRFIMGLKSGSSAQIDHVDGDGLNNRKENLRLATNRQNGKNKKTQINNVSGFKGVIWHKVNQKWVARIRSDGELIHLGSFDKLEEASRAYDRAALQYHGDFARLNHPKTDYLDRQGNFHFDLHTKTKKTGSSVFKGVWKRGNRWAAVISNNYKRIHLGYFDKEKDAALAYVKASERFRKKK